MSYYKNKNKYRWIKQIKLIVKRSSDTVYKEGVVVTRRIMKSIFDELFTSVHSQKKFRTYKQRGKSLKISNNCTVWVLRKRKRDRKDFFISTKMMSIEVMLVIARNMVNSFSINTDQTWRAPFFNKHLRSNLRETNFHVSCEFSIVCVRELSLQPLFLQLIFFRSLSLRSEAQTYYRLDLQR